MPLITDYTKLPLPDRIKLVGEIWDSIAADAPESFGLSPSQKEELDRRVAEHNADPTTAIPWEQVRAKLFARQP